MRVGALSACIGLPRYVEPVSSEPRGRRNGGGSCEKLDLNAPCPGARNGRKPQRAPRKEREGPGEAQGLYANAVALCRASARNPAPPWSPAP
eukprot:524776-Pyramimonas_sp.AAC.1